MTPTEPEFGLLFLALFWLGVAVAAVAEWIWKKK